MSLRVGREQSSIAAHMHDLRVFDESGALIECMNQRVRFASFESPFGLLSGLANSPERALNWRVDFRF
jgi:hypothetical protein